jgi:glycine/D-amino acid oxidase-like deaminating enzyme
MSPDGLPIYEESKTHPGVFAITCHSGVTLASIHGLELGAALAKGGLPDALSHFSSERFHARPH